MGVLLRRPPRIRLGGNGIGRPESGRVAMHPWTRRFGGYYGDLHRRARPTRGRCSNSQHAGWPGTHGNFRKCNTTWGVLLHHLRDYVETGDAATAFE